SRACGDGSEPDVVRVHRDAAFGKAEPSTTARSLELAVVAWSGLPLARAHRVRIGEVKRTSRQHAAVKRPSRARSLTGAPTPDRGLLLDSWSATVLGRGP